MKADVATAILLIERNQPLPLDLVFRLAEAGVDVQALEEQYAP